MNWDYLKKTIGFRIQLQPEPIRLDENGRELTPRNDEWQISEATATGVRILNITSGHTTILGKDHVHHFTSNPNRSVEGGLQYGFLTLQVQIYLQGNNLFIWPCARPGEPLPPPPVRIVQKWVDSNYPSDSGIIAKLQSHGYRVAWCFDSLLSRKVELEGWEIVVEKTNDGMLASFHLKDGPENHVLIKTRSPDLDVLAARTSELLRSQPGFLECNVQSVTPPILAFRFSTPTDAVQFLMHLGQAKSPFRHTLAPGRVDTVLEYRT